MPYNSLTTRSNASPLIPEDVQHQIIEGAVQMSSVMRLGKRLPNLPRAQQRWPVLSVLPTAYFVNPTDTGMKQTTQMQWANKYINAEELAVIVPIPAAVRDDVDYDIWSEIQPRVEEAIGLAFDAAVYYGTNAPGTWPNAIITDATSAGNYASLAAAPYNGDLWEALEGDQGIVAKLEADGYFATGAVGSLSLRGKMRGARSSTGEPIFSQAPVNGQSTVMTSYSVDGVPIDFPRNGAIDDTQSLLITGDFANLVWAVRQELTVTILDQGVITDNSTPPNIIYNLPQQDMIAARFVIRLGWQVPNPINRVNTDNSNRYPFAVLKP